MFLRYTNAAILWLQYIVHPYYYYYYYHHHHHHHHHPLISSALKVANLKCFLIKLYMHYLCLLPDLPARLSSSNRFHYLNNST
jgi:hypothetical protein